MKRAVLDKEFWNGLAPHMHVANRDFLQNQGRLAIDEPSVQSLRSLLNREGYFQVPPPEWKLPISDMAALISELVVRGLPTPFCFIYDEFWCLFFRLNGIIEAMLGPGFARLPDFWAWQVDPGRSESGWAPHRDTGYQSLFEDKSPKAVTVWIPLSESTPLNGCMYIVPADRDPTYGTPDDKVWKFGYPDIRALPATAGSILVWNQAVLHWGAHAVERAPHPRISVAFEFQSARAAPFNQPLTNPYTIPDFQFRTRLIAKQILQYKHMYPLSPDVEKTAQEILQSA